jgi:hypothetical protein
MMKRIGVVLGFAAGYYLGSMAGRERNEQINDVLRKAQHSSAVNFAGSKAKEVAGRDRARVRGAGGASQAGGHAQMDEAAAVSPVEGAVE